MKRRLANLRRRLFTVLAVVSLFLCLATLALWVRSYYRADSIGYYRIREHVQRGAFAGSVYGEVQLGATSFEGRALNDPGWRIVNQDVHDELKLASLKPEATVILGFGFASMRPLPLFHLRVIAFPHWFLALLFAILPTVRLRSILRSRGTGLHGLCTTCGYDLRATPDRCPECGTEKGLTREKLKGPRPLSQGRRGG